MSSLGLYKDSGAGSGAQSPQLVSCCRGEAAMVPSSLCVLDSWPKVFNMNPPQTHSDCQTPVRAAASPSLDWAGARAPGQGVCVPVQSLIRAWY